MTSEQVGAVAVAASAATSIAGREIQLYDGTGWRSAHPGDFLYVPEGGRHGFRGSDHASMLLMFAPGGPREDYFETLAALAENPMTDEELAEFMVRHDTYWV